MGIFLGVDKFKIFRDICLIFMLYFGGGMGEGK